jgi:hypothetical protein
MKKLLIALALPLWAAQVHAQIYTTYGPPEPHNIDAGYMSDYSANGTVVLAGGAVTLMNGATYEHGNLMLQNDGIWSSQSGSTDLFDVPGAVTISGTTAPQFYNLQLQNGDAVSITNTAGVDIAGQLDFGTGGPVNTVKANHSNGALRFADNATYTGGLSDAQHVNGYVTKTGNDAFTFPVGSGSDLRTLSISAPAAATDAYSVAWLAGDPGAVGDPSDANALHATGAYAAPISSVSTAGQWDWIPVSGTGEGLTITVSLPDGLVAAMPEDLRLVGWNGSAWVDLSGGSNATGNTEGSTLSGTMIAGITAIGIGSVSTALPVIFSEFSVKKQECAAVLNWTTDMELNNDHFVVERSTDGSNFTVIAEVAAAGNSNTRQEYAYSDDQPANGVNYYRVVQVDVDGKRSSTAIRSLLMHCGNGQLKVYPTVTKGTVYVAMPPGYENTKLSVMGINGQLVPASIMGGGLLRTVQLPTLPAGTYLISIAHNGTMKTVKILYQP